MKLVRTVDAGKVRRRRFERLVRAGVGQNVLQLKFCPKKFESNYVRKSSIR